MTYNILIMLALFVVCSANIWLGTDKFTFRNTNMVTFLTGVVGFGYAVFMAVLLSLGYIE